MTADQCDDETLAQRIAAGDEAAFVELYRRRSRGVYRFAYQMSGSAAVAEEVVQDVFLALMREAGRFEPARARSCRISTASPATTCCGSSGGARSWPSTRGLTSSSA